MSQYSEEPSGYSEYFGQKLGGTVHWINGCLLTNVQAPPQLESPLCGVAPFAAGAAHKQETSHAHPSKNEDEHLGWQAADAGRIVRGIGHRKFACPLGTQKRGRSTDLVFT